MIIYHQSNVAAFAGAHTFYWPIGPLGLLRVSITSAGGPAASDTIRQVGLMVQIGKLMNR